MILDIPGELQSCILSYLNDFERSQLALTCKQLWHIVSLQCPAALTQRELVYQAGLMLMDNWSWCAVQRRLCFNAPTLLEVIAVASTFPLVLSEAMFVAYCSDGEIEASVVSNTRHTDATCSLLFESVRHPGNVLQFSVCDTVYRNIVAKRVYSVSGRCNCTSCTHRPLCGMRRVMHVLSPNEHCVNNVSQLAVLVFDTLKHVCPTAVVYSTCGQPIGINLIEVAISLRRCAHWLGCMMPTNYERSGDIFLSRFNRVVKLK